MKSKNIGLFISVVFIYILLIYFFIWIIWRETILSIWTVYPDLLINKDIVLINIIIHVAGTYFFATIFEFIILLIFLKHFHLKFKVFTFIPFIKLITYPLLLIAYPLLLIFSIFTSLILLIFCIYIAGSSTVYIEYVLLLYKFEKSGVWILDKKLKGLTLAGIILVNIILFSYNLFLMGIGPLPFFLSDPFKSF